MRISRTNIFPCLFSTHSAKSILSAAERADFAEENFYCLIFNQLLLQNPSYPPRALRRGAQPKGRILRTKIFPFLSTTYVSEFSPVEAERRPHHLGGEPVEWAVFAVFADVFLRTQPPDPIYRLRKPHPPSVCHSEPLRALDGEESACPWLRVQPTGLPCPRWGLAEGRNPPLVQPTGLRPWGGPVAHLPDGQAEAAGLNGIISGSGGEAKKGFAVGLFPEQHPNQPGQLDLFFLALRRRFCRQGPRRRRLQPRRRYQPCGKGRSTTLRG